MKIITIKPLDLTVRDCVCMGFGVFVGCVVGCGGFAAMGTAIAVPAFGVGVIAYCLADKAWGITAGVIENVSIHDDAKHFAIDCAAKIYCLFD